MAKKRAKKSKPEEIIEKDGIFIGALKSTINFIKTAGISVTVDSDAIKTTVSKSKDNELDIAIDTDGVKTGLSVGKDGEVQLSIDGSEDRSDDN